MEAQATATQPPAAPVASLPVTKCSFADSKAIFHYKCAGAGGTTSHGTMAWCEDEVPPYSDAVHRAVRARVFTEAFPTRSVTSMNESDFQCDLLMMRVPPVDEAQKLRRAAVARGFARSCAPTFDINGGVMRNEFTCTYSGPITDSMGRRGTHPSKQISGTLFSCDMSMDITDELMEDVKLAAYDRAGGDEAQLDINGFSCNIMSIPH